MSLKSLLTKMTSLDFEQRAKGMREVRKDTNLLTGSYGRPSSCTKFLLAQHAGTLALSCTHTTQIIISKGAIGPETLDSRRKSQLIRVKRQTTKIKLLLHIHDVVRRLCFKLFTRVHEAKRGKTKQKDPSS